MKTTLGGIVGVFLLLGCGDGASQSKSPFQTSEKLSFQDDGEPCNIDDECSHGLCVPILPNAADFVGVCWGDGLPGCLRVFLSQPSMDACLTIGMADAICSPTSLDELGDRCVPIPDGQETTYPYVCCETTVFE